MALLELKGITAGYGQNVTAAEFRQKLSLAP